MSRHKSAKLARKNLEKRLGPLRDVDFVRPRGGWIRAIRESLGMSSRQLAKRMSVSQSRMSDLERAEAKGNPTLKSLREAAEALDCKLVYALVPNHPLDAIVQDRAEDKAIKQMGSVSHGMLLENQSLTPEQAREERVRLAREYLSEPIGRLWEDP